MSGLPAILASISNPGPSSKPLGKKYRRIDDQGTKKLGDTFSVPDKQFSQQFAPLYSQRLSKLAPSVIAAVPKRSVQIPIVDRVIDVQKDKLCILSGTIFKDMKLKPCILDEYTKSKIVKSALTTTKSFLSDDDSLILEDTHGRIPLVLHPDSKISTASLITGLVAAVEGRQLSTGEFEVVSIYFPGIPPQLSPPGKQEQYVALISGLSFGEGSHDPLKAQLMFDYLTGFIGSNQEIDFVSRISRVVIAGNSLARPLKERKNSTKKRTDREKVASALYDLDVFLAQLAASLRVDLMPGETDPSNFTLPQQPLFPFLFPRARVYSTFRTTTNPYLFEIGDGKSSCRFLGTSGQNIDDLARYSSASSNIDFLENTLRWRNLAPSAPDTLGCYPFESKDPFIINDCPHVYFAGNQEKFETRFIQGENGQRVRLVLIPSFATTGTIIIINTATLDAYPISFNYDESLSGEASSSGSNNR